MKRCLECAAEYPAVLSACPICGFEPVHVDGFIAHAPQLAHAGGGFEAGYFPVLAGLEASNFWFRARNELILWAMQRYCGTFQSYFEIGCGTGFVLQGIANRFPHTALAASEIFTAGLGFASQRVPGANLMQMDARAIPFSAEFDVLGAFDVLEHIDDDVAVLAQAFKALRPGGHLLLTVPQHAWLWSPSDDYARHERRYSSVELHAKVGAAGFVLRRSTSFVSLLLPLMLASRLKSRRRRQEFDPLDEFDLPHWVNKVLYGVMTSERGLIRLGLKLPWGGSRLVVAQKPG